MLPIVSVNIATSNADAAFALANNILSGNVALPNLSINIGGSIFFSEAILTHRVIDLQYLLPMTCLILIQT
jgi:hypothetical protein